MDSWIDAFIHGYKKSVADKKSRGVMSITEGKSPLSFCRFVRICSFFVSVPNSTKYLTWHLIMFGWLFMVLCWNLIGRSNTVGNIMLQHIDWSEDCLKIKIAKQKGWCIIKNGFDRRFTKITPLSTLTFFDADM